MFNATTYVIMKETIYICQTIWQQNRYYTNI